MIIMKLLTLSSSGVSQELLDQLDLTGSLDIATDFDSDYSIPGKQVGRKRTPLKVAFKAYFKLYHQSASFESLNFSQKKKPSQTRCFDTR